MSKLEQDQKDIVIAQLQAENEKYRQTDWDCTSLHNKLLDLEQRFNLLLEEKKAAESESRQSEAVHRQNHETLSADINAFHADLEEQQKALQEAAADLEAYKRLSADKTKEGNRLKQQLENSAADNEALLQAKKDLEANLLTELEKKKAAHTEADRLALLNDRASGTEAGTADRLKGNLLEATTLQRKINVLNVSIKDLEAVKRKHDLDTDNALKAKKNHQDDAARLLGANGQLQEETRDLSANIKNAELQLLKQGQKLDDTLTLLSAREKELGVARSGLTYADGKALETSEKARKLQRDNEVLQSLLDKYRNDVEYQRKLRLAETSRKLELEQHKKQLEREVVTHQLEAHSIKQELNRVRSDKERLLDDHQQLNEELSAFKEHADLLAAQNTTVKALLTFSCTANSTASLRPTSMCATTSTVRTTSSTSRPRTRTN